MSGLTIRRYEPSDDERVRELHEDVMRQEGAYDENFPDRDLERIEEEYLSNGEFLVGEVDGRIVAMGAIRPVSEAMAELHETTVAPVVELKRMRVDPAQRLYEGNGFEYERRVELDAFGGSIELLLYRKSLAD
ncbi:GNAT family N-acetyltransferase [Haladaptatus sp. CMAA 1911]|uniref:GNAT family N-acetyltransferase n=1 Tax=unclassified Haladaptatus TaxID=2622732 RepID=UPI003754E89F